jgi:List-Bact-rpt repeat protein
LCRIGSGGTVFYDLNVRFLSLAAAALAALAAVSSSAGQAASPTLTVTVEGPGKGTVVSKPAGVSCPGTCAHQFVAGTRVTLVAVPAAGSHSFGGPTVEYYLSSWGGACSGEAPSCVLTLDGDRNVTASFAEIQGDPLFEIASPKVSIVKTKSARRIVVSFRASLPGSGTLRLVRRRKAFYRTAVRVRRGRNVVVVALPRAFPAGPCELDVDLTGQNGVGRIAKAIRIPPA